MKETPLSNCEREFILKAVNERKRLDGREVYDYRRTKITFGVDRGCCSVEVGCTRVMSQVSCEVTPPKQSRPSEGILFVNVELSPMAAPQFEPGRQSEFGVELNRLLERCLKESRCVDTESLCIMAGIKVWTVRVDIHVLNYDGNLTDCASIAAIAALTHFRRPDVTVSGEDVTIHSTEDRDPIPLSVHHMPICVTFAFFEQGKFLLVDPSEKEERVMEGKMVIGMNKHREICTLQMTGSMLLLKDQVLRCSNIAVVKVTEITELIQQALQNDTKARSTGQKFGFAASIETRKVTASEKGEEPVAMEERADDILRSQLQQEEEAEPKAKVTVLGKGTAQIGEGGTSTWDDIEERSDDEMEDRLSEPAEQQAVSRLQPPVATSGDLSGESEEDDVITLESEDLEMITRAKKPEPLLGNTIDLTMALKSKKKGTGHKAKKKSK